VCPVVADYQQDPRFMGYLDLTPQQIMNTYRLGITEWALNSKMVWDCFMCFKCQEHCPQQIPVAEIIYSLRNKAYQKLKQSVTIQTNGVARLQREDLIRPGEPADGQTVQPKVKGLINAI
jgi:heterodisulfide reductase subunit C